MNLVGHGAGGIADLLASGWCSGHTDAGMGTLDTDLNLLPDGMDGVLIPPASVVESGYMLLRALTAGALTTSAVAVGDHGTHAHTAPEADLLEAGDRVAFLWIGARPLILGTI